MISETMPSRTYQSWRRRIKMLFRSFRPSQWPLRTSLSLVRLCLLPESAHPSRHWREARYYLCQYSEYYPTPKLPKFPIDLRLPRDSARPTCHQAGLATIPRLCLFRLLRAKMGKDVAKPRTTRQVYPISQAAFRHLGAFSKLRECLLVFKRLLRPYRLQSRLEAVLKSRPH